jgi:hypothetical protein
MVAKVASEPRRPAVWTINSRTRWPSDYTFAALSQPNQSAFDDPLEHLVHELLLVRTEELTGSQLAAFVDGWSSLLDLVRRTDLILPNATDEVVEAIADVVERIRAAQSKVLDDGTG